MEEWVDDRLAEAGLHRTGELTCVHDRPWATVYTAPTIGGPVWLKAPGPGARFEVALYELLAKVAPDRIPRPIALDLDRCLLLLPDGGATLGAQLGELDLTDTLVTVLPQYGQLQRDLVPYTDSLLSFGVTDMRPAIMPARFDKAVAVTDPPRAVREMRATFTEWCARLDASPVPASLDHNDLHMWNVFFAGGQARFYDWGTVLNWSLRSSAAASFRRRVLEARTSLFEHTPRSVRRRLLHSAPGSYRTRSRACSSRSRWSATSWASAPPTRP
jgi:hypothetical protein